MRLFRREIATVDGVYADLLEYIGQLEAELDEKPSEQVKLDKLDACYEIERTLAFLKQYPEEQKDPAYLSELVRLCKQQKFTQGFFSTRFANFIVRLEDLLAEKQPLRQKYEFKIDEKLALPSFLSEQLRASLIAAYVDLKKRAQPSEDDLKEKQNKLLTKFKFIITQLHEVFLDENELGGKNFRSLMYFTSAISLSDDENFVTLHYFLSKHLEGSKEALFASDSDLFNRVTFYESSFEDRCRAAALFNND